MTTKYKINDDAVVIDNGYSLDLYVHDVKKHLYPQTKKILRLLIEAGMHNWKVSTERMYECLWGEFQGKEKSCNDTIRGCIRQLRRALGKEAVQNEYGVGYYLQEIPNVIDDEDPDESATSQKPKVQITNANENPQKSRVRVYTKNSIVPSENELSVRRIVDTALINGLCTEGEPPVPANGRFCIEDLLDRIARVNAELFDIHELYKKTQNTINTEISHSSEKSAVIDAYIITLMSLSQNLEGEFEKVRKLCISRDECRHDTDNLINAEDSLRCNASIDGSGSNISSNIHCQHEFVKVEEKIMILDSKVREVKYKIEEICRELDFVKSTKERFFNPLNENFTIK